MSIFGTPDRIRTCNRRLRRPMLYPVELRALVPVTACLFCAMVGVEGFEPPTSCSQSRRATRLRYTPRESLSGLDPNAICCRAGHSRSGDDWRQTPPCAFYAAKRCGQECIATSAEKSAVAKRTMTGGRRSRAANKNASGHSQLAFLLKSGAPGEIRTPDHQVRSLVLYPTELRAHRAPHFGEHPRQRQASTDDYRCWVHKRCDSPSTLPHHRANSP